MSKKRVTWLVLVVALMAVMSAVVAVQTEAGPPPNCRFVLCAYPDCIEGEHTEIPPGQCCPVCVPD